MPELGALDSLINQSFSSCFSRNHRSAAACGAATLRWQIQPTVRINVPLPHTIIRWPVENFLIVENFI
jgi:hypothetical protein